MENTNIGMKEKIQKFGSYLSSMVMPNIGAFIAWGIITALFIPTGWVPNEKLAALVDPMIAYLLPLLIAYSGGKMIYDHRGGVVGATAAMGVIVGSSIPMFLGAMLVGPLGGYLIKQVDKVFENKVKSGFEMLINNFTAGILAAILALLSYVGIGPVVLALNNVLASGVEFIINMGLLPLAHIFVEPAKVLFLNNAINHGILGPLGIEQAAELGKSILFMVESNPGPGLGVLLAYMLFGKGSARASAYGSSIIHFFGGIHEIYFPYILMNPVLLLAVMAGGATGTLVFNLFKVGLVATPSPGSIFAYIAMTPRGDYIGVLLGVLAATVVSFLVASTILKISKKTSDYEIEDAVSKMEEMKGKKSSVSSTIVSDGSVASIEQVYQDVKKIVFACDAGMGSSAMGASILNKKMKEAGLDVQVSNSSINNLTEDIDIIITHKDLTPRAKSKIPNAHHISVDNFLGSPIYDEIIENIKK